jgi:iron complex outermembrane receptor protein
LTSFTRTTLLACALIGSSIATAYAVDAPLSADDAAAGPKTDDQLEVITVTATRQARPLQDVPVSVGVVTGKQFTETGYKNPSDLQFLSPSIQVATAGGVGFAIRGVGTQSNNLSNEQAVGTVVDGVAYGFNDDIGLDLTGLDHIELLRGPQGTTFGKSSTAGVINITTVKPSFDGLRADLQGSYGSFNDTNSYAQINAPITDKLASYFSVAFKNRDGLVYNPVLMRQAGKSFQLSYRAKLLWNPTDDLSVYFNSDYHSTRTTPNFNSTFKSIGPLKGSGILNYGIVPGPHNMKNGDSTSSGRLTDTGGASIQADQRIGDLTLSSISAVRLLHKNLASTRNDTPIIYLNDDEQTNIMQVSQELRIASPTTGRFQYLGGIYYYDRTTQDKLLTSGPYAGLAEQVYGPGALVSNAGGRQYAKNDVQNVAAYANGIFEITDALKLNAGTRLTYDHADASAHAVPVAGIFTLPGGSIEKPSAKAAQDRNISYRLGAQYFVTPDVSTYFTASRGYKGAVAAVINGVGVQIALPETVQAYELGIKTSLFDHHATFNIAAFHEHYKNFQTSVLDTSLTPPTFVLGNAGGMTSKGVEADFTVRPISELTFNTGVTYQDARYTDFRAPCYVFQPVATNSAGLGGCSTIPGTNSKFTQAGGSPLQNASKWNITVSASYTHPITDSLDLDILVNNTFRTKFATTGYNPHTFINGYNITGINIGLKDSESRWRVSLFVRNLFDRYYVSALQQASFDTGGYTQVVDPESRRTVGVQFNYHFF